MATTLLCIILPVAARFACVVDGEVVDVLLGGEDGGEAETAGVEDDDGVRGAVDDDGVATDAMFIPDSIVELLDEVRFCGDVVFGGSCALHWD